MRKTLRFLTCASLSAAYAVAALNLALAQTYALDVQVMEHANGDLDTCALGQVAAPLKEGEGFLVARSGPGRNFDEIGQLQSGDEVWLFDRQGEWLGIVFGVVELSCNPIENDQVVRTEGKKGWVHEKWIEVLAG